MFYERFATQKISGSSGVTTVVSQHEGVLHGITVTGVVGGQIKLFDASGAVGTSFADLQIPAGATQLYTILMDARLLHGLTVQNVSYPGTITVLYK